MRGKTIKEIVRELHVSRNTVRKVLRSGATEFTYQREIQPLPKLGRWKAELDRLLAANEAKPARERLTLIRVFEALRALGYAGGYDAAQTIPRSPTASTTWPRSTPRRGATPRPSRSTSARWRSARRHSAQITLTSPTASTTWPRSTQSRAGTPRPTRYSSVRWPFAKRRSAGPPGCGHEPSIV